MKKAVGFSLFLLLLSTVFLLVLASGNTDPFLHFLNVTPIESLLSATDQAKLLETYADEFAFLNQKHGNTIRSIDESAIKLIQAEASAVAIEGNGLAFAALLEEIGALRFARAVTMFNSNGASVGGGASPLRVRPDQLEVRNAVRTTVVPYGALKAQHDIDDPVGVTYAQSVTADIDVEAGEILKGYKITAFVSASVSGSISGPADFTEVKSGVYATHRAGYSVLFGRIERYTYDLYYTYTGELHSHNEIISIRDQNAEYYTFLVSYGGPTYLKHARYTTCYTFSSKQACITSVSQHPETYIN